MNVRLADRNSCAACLLLGAAVRALYRVLSFSVMQWCLVAVNVADGSTKLTGIPGCMQ